MAYLRQAQEQGEDQLVVAKADGSGETVIARRPSRLKGFGGVNPSWSATGDLLAVAAYQSGGNQISVLQILTVDGKEVKEFPLPMQVGAIAWMPDNSGLFFTGWGKAGTIGQIWFQPYPEGAAVRVTNDLTNYIGVSVTGDGKALVTSQKKPASTIYVGDAPASLDEKTQWKLKPISSEQAPGYWLSWTGDNRLLQADAAGHAFVSAADGSDRARLLQGEQWIGNPTRCGSGKMILFSQLSETNTGGLYRMNLETGEVKPLTQEGGEYSSGVCTPDGKWALYEGDRAGGGYIARIAIEGGEPKELAKGQINHGPVISPDGELMAYTRWEGQGANAKLKFVLQKLEPGAPVKEIDAPVTTTLVNWTADGRGLTFVRTTGTSINLYLQPLAGGPAVQLTRFEEEPSAIVAYAWSRDRKRIAITRARFNDTDVVMFSGFR
jgi:Tol biopolymer transport system component